MFYLIQAGSSLQAAQTTGTVTTLTLPSGVTISSTIKGKFAILDQKMVFVGAPTVSLWIDPLDLTVRPMHILPPLNAPTLAAGAGTGLTGAYRCGVGYATKNAAGIIVNRSPVTGPSVAVSVTNKDLDYTNIPISPDSNVNCRILYRTAASGADLFELLQIDDNVTVAVSSNAMTDATLSDQIADPTIDIAPGAVPGTSLTLITEWKSRLWGVSGRFDERDDLRYTEVNQFYGWSAENSLPAYPRGEDAFGITGLARRRDALGILKRSRVMKVIGSSNDDFEVIILAVGPGCCAPESVVVIQDRAYFLGLDGVYRWDDSGVVCISRDAVDPWFTTDTYFNRARFPDAFGSWNPVTNAYELQLASIAGSTLDRWVTFHIDANGGKGEWLGPHSTSACTPTCRAQLETATGLYVPAIGASDGFIYQQNSGTAFDAPGPLFGTHLAISARIDTKWHADQFPDAVHFWGRLSVLARIEGAETAGTLTITPFVGRLGASGGTPLSMNTTLGRQILGRLGVGPLMKLSFTQATSGTRFLLYGYEVKPVFEVGVR